MQRALGMRRSIWAKVLPIATIGFAYLPAIVFVGIVALFPTSDVAAEALLPTYGDYYGFVIAAIMVFVALVAPEVLCTDRRTGMLGVYLASPLDRDSYLFAKAAEHRRGALARVPRPAAADARANVLQSTGPEGIGDIARHHAGACSPTGVVDHPAVHRHHHGRDQPHRPQGRRRRRRSSCSS